MTNSVNRRRSPVNYRKIYEKHFGQIPKDSEGRKYDIHHIDGDHTNNDISNLKAVTIQEHYDIHYAQGDWFACLLIAERLSMSPELLSNLSSNAAKARINSGNHHFSNSEWQRQNQKKLVEEGRHNFTGGEISRRTNKKLLEEGKHVFQGDSGVTRRKIKEGSHHFQDHRNPVYKMVKDKTHPWLKENGGSQKAREKAIKRIKDGSHHFITGNPNNIIITCPHCNKSGSKPGMMSWHFDKCKKKT